MFFKIRFLAAAMVTVSAAILRTMVETIIGSIEAITIPDGASSTMPMSNAKLLSEFFMQRGEQAIGFERQGAESDSSGVGERISDCRGHRIVRTLAH